MNFYQNALLTTESVSSITGIAKPSLANYVKQGIFPKPISLGPKTRKVWRREDVAKWLEELGCSFPETA